MRHLTLALLVLAAFGAGSAQAKNVPSFALWIAHWKAQTDASQSKISDACLALYGKTADRKIGECFVKGMRVVLREEQPQWERGVTKIARGHSAACKKVIHTYWLASRKAQAASLIYLDSHPHRDITAVASDLREEPYATFKSVLDAAKSRAIRVCG